VLVVGQEIVEVKKEEKIEEEEIDVYPIARL